MFKINTFFILVFIILDYFFSFSFTDDELKSNISSTYLNKQSLNNLLNQDINFLKKKNLFFPQNKINNDIKLLKEKKIKRQKHKRTYLIPKKNIYKFPNYLLKEIEEDVNRKKINELIRKSEKEKINKFSNIINDEIYSDDYIFYVNKNNLAFDSLYTWPRYIKKNAKFIEYKTSRIQDIIQTNPQELKITVPICILKKIEFKIYNPDTINNLIINDIKTDIYQIKIFPLTQDKKLTSKQIMTINPINFNLPYSIYSNIPYVFQLLILADYPEIIRGTLYISFNNNQVLLIPIFIKGIKNSYNISPIYFHDLKKGTSFSYSIQISNPKNKILIISDVVHYFKKISILWPNGVAITDNSSSISANMLQINPKSKKNIIYLKYFSENEEYEFNYIHIKIDKKKFIIPVLLGFLKSDIEIFPSFFNFGLCNISPKNLNNILKIIPLDITNYYHQPISISNVYINTDEKFIKFNYLFKQKKILIQPNVTLTYGNLIFDGNINQNVTELINKTITGSIYLEINNYIQSLIEIKYSYFLIKDKYQKIVKMNKISNNTNQQKKFKIEYKISPPLNLEMDLIQNPGEYIIKNYENFLTIKYQNPLFWNETNTTIMRILIDDLDYIEKERYFFFPLKLSFNLFTLIPLKYDNSNIDYLYCGNKYDSFSDCIQSKYHILEKNFLSDDNTDFKTKIFIDIVVNENKNKKVYFFLINENSFSKRILNVKINNKLVKVKIEDYISFGKIESKKKTGLKKVNLLRLMKTNKKSLKHKLKLFKNSAIKFSIQYKNTKIYKKSKLIFFFKKQKKLIIEIIPKILKGNLNFTPSIIRFEPGFHGLNQTKKISCKSSFPTIINITNAISSDKRIIPNILSNTIFENNRTEVIKLTFAPEKKENFITDINKKYITYRDLFLWKEKQKLWEELGNLGKTEINANLSISTDINKENIQIKAFLTKPNLFEKDEVDLGLVQIGEYENIFIEGFNPSDEIMSFRVFLASEEFSDINNNSMFNKSEKYKFDGNNVFIMKCIFDSYDFSGKKIFDDDKNNIIILEENEKEEIFRDLNNKEVILEKMIFYANDEIRQKIFNSSKIICRYSKKLKNQIIEEKNQYLLSKIFSLNFTSNIPIVKEMTENTLNYFLWKRKKELNKKSKNIFSKFFSFIEENLMLINKIVKIEQKEQTFFLPSNITNKIYNIPPHKNFTIGPIIFYPLNTKKSSATLLIKNNLTILYPIKLKGEGGTGKVQFFNYKNLKNPKIKLENESKVLINIDKNVFLNEIKNNNNYNNLSRTITLRNSGKMKMKINKISIENLGCEGYGMKILQCEQFSLRPAENIDIDIIISPNFNLFMIERKIFFYSDYQTIILYVVIKINDDLLKMQNTFINYKIYEKNILSIIIICVICKIVFNTIINELKNKNEGDLNFGKLYFIINGENEKLKFENLYIKIYKNNKLFLDDFSKKLLDKNIEDSSNKNNDKKNYTSLNSNENQSISSKSSKTDIDNLKGKNENDNNKNNKEEENKNRKQSKTKNRRKNRRQNKPIGMSEKDKNNNKKKIETDENKNIKSTIKSNLNYNSNNISTNNNVNINNINKYNSNNSKLNHIKNTSSYCFDGNDLYNHYYKNNRIYYSFYKNYPRKYSNYSSSYMNHYSYRKNLPQNKFNMNNIHYHRDLEELPNNDIIKDEIKENEIVKSPKKNYSNSSSPDRIIDKVLNDNYEEKKKQEKKEENYEFNNLNIENENDYEPISFGDFTKQNFFNDNLSDNGNEEEFNYSKLLEGNKLIENGNNYDENNINLNEQNIFENELLNGFVLNDFVNNDFGKKLFNSNPFCYTIHKGKLSDLFDDKNNI